MLSFFFLFAFKAFSAEGYSCLGYPKTYSAEISQHFYAIKDALPSDDSKSSLYRDFIQHQNVHTFPNMHIFQPEKSILHGSYDLKKMDIKIIKEEEIEMPYALYLESLVAPKFFSPSVQIYLKKIEELKAKIKSMKVLKVSYELRTVLALCQKTTTPISTLKLPQPLDPWLTYFLVDPKLKVERELPYLGRLKVNPCTTRPMIDPDRGEGFWGMWYFWNPFQKNETTESPYDCT
ncbi:MAG: hypothetical protein LW878_03075, partial [Proteobacteria bacterium]|nr:hypothetical protein [Pseudomonadota bacterium]